MKIIEATLVMPVTCLIIVGLIGLMMTFYNELIVQIEEHEVERNNIYQTREVTYIRIYDKVYYEFTE